MRRRALKDIWKTKEKNYKSTSTFLPRREGKFKVETNALGHAIRGVVS